MRNANPESIVLKSPLAAAARSILRNGCKKAKMHTISSHKNCIWNVPLLLFSVICQMYSSDTHFIQSSFTTSFSSPSPVGILTLENFDSSFLLCSLPVTLDKLNLSSPFSNAYSEAFHFFTPESIYFRFIHEIVLTEFVSAGLFLCTSIDFILDFAATASLRHLFKKLFILNFF